MQQNGFMPNIANIFKAEITRVARKEVRAEVDSLRKALAAQRSAIAALKREIADLHKGMKRVQPARSAQAAPAGDAAEEGVKRRFSATRLVAHRQKTGLSAAQYGALVGVSGQSIYKYEQGKARPHAQTVRKLSELKELSKAQLEALLADTQAHSDSQE